MKFRILILYKSEEALHKYLKRFNSILTEPDLTIKKCSHSEVYSTSYTEIICLKRTNLMSMYGIRTHILAIQEELTWIEDYDKICKTIFMPFILSPIPTQVFDGDIEIKEV